MAPSGVGPPLEATRSRSSKGRGWRSGPRGEDGGGESVVGSTSHPRRIVQTGHRGVRTYGVAASATRTSAAVTDVADISDQSRERHAHAATRSSPDRRWCDSVPGSRWPSPSLRATRSLTTPSTSHFRESPACARTCPRQPDRADCQQSCSSRHQLWRRSRRRPRAEPNWFWRRTPLPERHVDVVQGGGSDSSTSPPAAGTASLPPGRSTERIPPARFDTRGACE